VEAEKMITEEDFSIDELVSQINSFELFRYR